MDGTYGQPSLDAARAAPRDFILADFRLTGGDRALVLGDATDGENIFVNRLTASGADDPAFGDGSAGGGTLVRFPGFDSTASGAALALQADGKIIAAAEVRTDGDSNEYPALARLTPGGRLDTTFSADGRVVTRVALNWEVGRVTDVVVDGQGRVLLAAIADVFPNAVATLIRYQGGDDGGGGDPVDAAGTLRITGTASRDEVLVERVGTGGGTLRFTVNGASREVPASRVRRVEVQGLAGDDTINIATAGVPGMLLGGAGDDRLTGSALNDSLHGGTGDDTLDGGRGGDDLSGGDGFDTLDYSSRTAAVRVGLGTVADDGEAKERDNARADIEIVNGGSGADRLFGTSATNVFHGNGGNDELYGRGGDDALFGGPGVDALHGDEGNDSLFGRDGEHDFLAGGFGTDTAEKDDRDTTNGVERFV